MSDLTRILKKQLQVQQCVDDAVFPTLAEDRDAMLRSLTVRERLQLKLACGILERLVG